MSETGGAAVRPWQPRPEAIARVRAGRGRHRPALPDYDFDTGYLEFARPTIRDGLDALAARGARRILAVPGMLFAASHVKNDLPWEMNSFVADNPGVEVRLRPRPRDRREAARRRRRPHRRGRVAAGPRSRAATRCSSSSAAAPTIPTPIPTSPRSRACCGRAWGSAGPRSASAASPIRASTPALERAARLGFRRIVVFPYFLFTGVLVKRIYARDRRGRGALSRDRIRQGALSARPSAACSTPLPSGSPRSDAGNPAMNCQLCKYRTQIVGYEDEVGAPQAGIITMSAASAPTTMGTTAMTTVTAITTTITTARRSSIVAPVRPVRHLSDRRLERGEHAEDRARQHLDLPAGARAAGMRIAALKTRRPGTRPTTACATILADGAAREARAVLVGFDFPFGYPRGLRRAARASLAALAGDLGRDRRAGRGRRAQPQQPLRGRGGAQPAGLRRPVPVLGLPAGARRGRASR